MAQNQPPLRSTVDPYTDYPNIKAGPTEPPPAPKPTISAMQQRDLRERCIDMALRLPNHPDQQTVVKTAAAFEKFITEGHTNEQ